MTEAVGLAIIRPSPRAQLPGDRRADGDLADVSRRGAVLCRRRPVQGHPLVQGRGGIGLS